MRKSILLLVIASLFVSKSSAQKSPIFKFGLKAGINYANLNGSDINTSALTSFHAGIVTEIKVFKYFAIQPELLYSTQGAELKDLGTQFKNELGYIAIPILAKFSLNDQLSLELGPQASFLLNEKNDFNVSKGLQ